MEQVLVMRTWMYAFSSSMSPGVRRMASVVSSRSRCRWTESLGGGRRGGVGLMMMMWWLAW